MEDEANELSIERGKRLGDAIKFQLGKLKLSLPLNELLKNQQETNDLHVLPLELKHVLALNALPLHHKDPFDRLLIAQSIEEDLILSPQTHIFPQTQLSC